MKKIILLFVITFVSLNVYSKDSKPLTFSEVITVEGVPKEAIYSTIMDWIATNYRNVDNDSQLSDKDAGLIVKQAAFVYEKKGLSYKCYSGYVYYKLKIQIREGRFKVELTSFVHEVNPGNAQSCRLGTITDDENYTKGGMQKRYNNEVWHDIKEEAALQAEDTFETLSNLDFDTFNPDEEEDW